MLTASLTLSPADCKDRIRSTKFRGIKRRDCPFLRLEGERALGRSTVDIGYRSGYARCSTDGQRPHGASSVWTPTASAPTMQSDRTHSNILRASRIPLCGGAKRGRAG